MTAIISSRLFRAIITILTAAVVSILQHYHLNVTVELNEAIDIVLGVGVGWILKALRVSYQDSGTE